MASFRDYAAKKVARIDLFDGHWLDVRQVSSPEFLAVALPFHRAKLDAEKSGSKLTDDEITRYNLSQVFALVDAWSFDDDLNLDNFIEFLQAPELAGITQQVIRNVDRVSADADAFVAKKPQISSAGSGDNGISTGEPVTRTRKPAAKR